MRNFQFLTSMSSKRSSNHPVRPLPSIRNESRVTWRNLHTQPPKRASSFSVKVSKGSPQIGRGRGAAGLGPRPRLGASLPVSQLWSPESPVIINYNGFLSFNNSRLPSVNFHQTVSAASAPPHLWRAFPTRVATGLQSHHGPTPSTLLGRTAKSSGGDAGNVL